MTGCTCTEPGWCARHQMVKSSHYHKLCQTRESYFAAWEAGNGPGQRKHDLTEQATGVKTESGWGDKVADFLKGIGITEESYKEIKLRFGLPPTCGCSRRREWLNRVGAWWKERTE